MVVNFRVREISRVALKLVRTPTLIKNIYIFIKFPLKSWYFILC